MIEVYMNLPKRRKRSLEDYWKIKKFQSGKSYITSSAGRKRECKNSPFLFLKNIKFLILWIDNMNELVYYIIKIKETRRNPNGKERIGIGNQNDGSRG